MEQKEFAVKEAKAEVKIKKTEIDVLKRFTKDEELVTLRGNWEAAKAAASGHEEVLAMDVARGQELGAHAVLEKPLNIKALVELLESAIPTQAPPPEA